MKLKMDEIVLKEYDSEERNACIELLEKTFPGTSDEATFKWRFEMDNRKRPLLICAKHYNRVVSFNSWIPWEFSYKTNKYSGYQSGESATDINYRGKGIFSKVLRYSAKIASDWRIDFMFGFPNEISYRAFIKAGYYPIGTNYFYLRPINPFKKRAESSANLNANYFFETMLTQPDKITPIFDYYYCNWRYLENPNDFEIVEYTENNSKAMFVFRRKKWKSLTELLLLDCQFGNYNDMFIDNSISFIDKVFSRRAAYMRTFFNQYSDRGRALRKHFSIRITSKFHVLIVKPISNRIDNNILLNCNCWDIMPHCVDEL